MRRIAALLISLLAVPSVFAEGNADALLSQMSAKLKAMGAYEVSFSVSASAFSAAGRYVVNGEEYQLTLGDAEVFCDGATRYEVNNALYEITIDSVNPSERNILNNPVGGLDFLSDEFSSTLVSRNAAATVIRLTPADNRNSSTIEVTVNNAAQLPERLVYRMAGDSVTVDLISIGPFSSAFRRFDPQNYKDYEIIDFR